MPKARVCIKAGPGQVALDEIDVADPGPGQVLVRATLSTICGSDIHMVDEIDEVPAGMPMGHEGCGVVEAVGDGVERFAVGDRVVSSCLLSCGTCARCLAGDGAICPEMGAPMNLLFGAQSELYLVAGADYSMTHLIDGADEHAALLASDVLSTGFGAIERAGVKAGDSVAIFAQGPVGLCATIAAKFYGADPIVAVDGIAHRRGVAERLGATHTFSPEDAVGRTSDLTGGMGVDVAVEALGRQETLDACFRVTRAGGTVSSVGVYAPLDVVRVPVDDRFYQRSFVTTLCPSGPKRLDWLLGLVRDGRIDVAPLFTHTAALSTIVDAYDRFRRHDDNILKIALAP